MTSQRFEDKLSWILQSQLHNKLAEQSYRQIDEPGQLYAKIQDPLYDQFEDVRSRIEHKIWYQI